MKILVTGATGLVGRALVKELAHEGHSVCRLVRPQTRTDGGTRDALDVAWNPETGELGGAAADADAVVNLAGAPISGGRWTDGRKRVLRSSRTDATRALVTVLGKMRARPTVLLSASAIGFYGNRGEQVLDEASGAGQGFLAEVAKEWEAEALRAEPWRTRVTVMRFGVILAKQGGALAKMLTPFRFGVGGRLGSGEQWMSWVALDDVVAVLQMALADPRLRGPINVVAPEPVTNAVFTRELAQALRRPALFPVPAFALRLALGEMADELLLSSQRVVPGILSRLGYSFSYPQLGPALRKMVHENA